MAELLETGGMYREGMLSAEKDGGTAVTAGWAEAMAAMKMMTEDSMDREERFLVNWVLDGYTLWA
jgi:hypothetical protein